MPPTRSSEPSESPFAPVSQPRSAVELRTIFVAMVLFAAIAMLLTLASRVPSIANSFGDFFGYRRVVSTGDTNRTSHLFLLLFCYASPSLLLIGAGLMRSFIDYQQGRLEKRQREQEIEDREYTMED